MDFSLPSSGTEIAVGLFLAVVVGMAWSVVTTFVIGFVRDGFKPPIIILIAAAFLLFVNFGGLLVFELPMWIAATALALGVSTAVIAQWTD